MSPVYVKAYLRRLKTTPPKPRLFARRFPGPTMHFVPTKSADSQGMLMLDRARLVRLIVRTRR